MNNRTQKHVLVVAVALIAAGTVAYTQLGENTENSGDNILNSNPETHEITFTGSGFQPASITIEQGDKVEFVDNSSSTMWVASDEHPTHTNYDGTSLRTHCNNAEPTFDQCDVGNSYTFQFNKTGSFGYHNHQPYVSGGTITVQ